MSSPLSAGIDDQLGMLLATRDQLSLAIPLWVGAMSTSKAWKVLHCISSSFVTQWHIHLQAQQPSQRDVHHNYAVFGIWQT